MADQPQHMAVLVTCERCKGLLPQPCACRGMSPLDRQREAAYIGPSVEEPADG